MNESIHVLHVDDEPGFASMVGTFLTRADDRIDVLPALRAEEGLTLLDEHDIDCIVSDHDMPGKNGIEFLRAVRRDHPDLPFILYTGKGSEEIASEAISAGVTEYLQKESGNSQYEILRNRIQNAVEQRRARAELAETERRLQTIAEHANDILWKFTGDWDELLFINSQYEEIWGWSVEELRQRPHSFLEGIHPDDRPLVTDAMERLSSGESVDVEYRVNADENFARWVWVQGEPVLDQEGVVEKVVGFAREITDRKLREKELETLRDRYEAFTRYSSDNITVIDGNGIIRYESPAVERLTGWRPEDLEGENTFEYIHPDDREHVLETFLNALDADESVTDRAEYRFKTADDSWVWIESVGTNLTESSIGGYVINSRDITERKAQERDLRERVKELTAIHNASAVFEPTDDPLEDLLSDFVEKLPESFQYPESTGARLTFDGDEIATAHYDPTAPMLAIVDQLTHGLELGLEVTCTESPPSTDEGVFLDEEHDLLETLFKIVKDHIERRSSVSDLKRYERIVEASGDPVYTLDGGGRFTYVNDRLIGMVGYDRNELLGADVSIVMDAGDIATGESLIESMLADERTRATFEMDIVTTHGSRIACENHIALLMDDGTFNGTVGVIRDITDRQTQLRALQRERDRFEAVFETVPEPIVHVAFEGSEPIVQRVNDAFETVFGFGTDEVHGSSLDDLILPDDAREEATEINRSVVETGVYQAEIRRETVGGERPFLFTAKTMDLGGERIEGVGTYVDLTEQKHRELELTRQNERLDAFATVLSHDLRNPLNVATGRLELVAQECESDHVDDIEDAHDRMALLIDDLLTLARGGQSVSEREPVELAELVKHGWASVETRDGSLIVEVDHPVEADASRLQQVFENLFRNAIQHGGPKVTVRVGELVGGFFVENDGPGVRDDIREEVFDAGYTTDRAGTGFGLSIVKQIVEAHGWSIRVTEGSDGGARFEITGITFATAEMTET